MINRIARKIEYLVRSLVYDPRVKLGRNVLTIRLGSSYGGWSFVDNPDLHNATILSCGLGEDASFDVEFASRYGARVVLVDPTPKAIKHYTEFAARFGMPSIRGYVDGGKQPIEAYDLSSVSQRNFLMIEKALWIRNEKVRFFAPKNRHHVSYSITNFQNKYSTDTAHIEVEAISIESLLNDLAIKSIPLLKLDIEGAEVEVIPDMLKRDIRPKQLLVEFDELGRPSKRAALNYKITDERLRNAGYKVAHFDGHTNFLYLLDNSA